MESIKIGTTGGTIHKAPKDYYCIGFSGTFYCLWRVVYEYAGEYYGFVDRGHYMGRLSIDLERAKEKAAESVGNFVVDLERRGTRWISSYGPKKRRVYEPFQFPYGKLAGDDIRTATDVWQLFRLYECFPNEQYSHRDEYPNAQYAKARLIELGELVEFNGEWIRAEYLEDRKRAAQLETAIRGHHETNGARVELEVTLMGEFSFDGFYGTCYVQTFVDSNNRVFKYMGSAPVRVEMGETITVMATISHDNYNDEDETKLKRIKKIN